MGAIGGVTFTFMLDFQGSKMLGAGMSFSSGNLRTKFANEGID